jgi:methionyl-tRNA formyltransferase
MIFRANEHTIAVIDGREERCRVIFPTVDGRYYIYLLRQRRYLMVDKDRLPLPPRPLYKRLNTNCHIVFFGNGNFALPSLMELLARGYAVDTVVTMPDREQGRGLRIHPSMVKQYAEAKGLRVLQPREFNADFLRELGHPDLGVVVEFRVLPAEVFNLPRFGTINVHPSLLPRYRGSTPVNHAVLNRDEFTGVSTFLLNDSIDKGGVYLNMGIPLCHDLSAGEVSTALARIGAELLSDTIQLALSRRRPVQQSRLQSPLTAACYAPRFSASFYHTDFNLTAEEFASRCQALSPRPALHCLVGGLPCKVYAADKTDRPRGDYDVGTVVLTRREVFVACQDRFVRLKMIKPENHNSMSANAFICGYAEKVTHIKGF